MQGTTLRQRFILWQRRFIAFACVLALPLITGFSVFAQQPAQENPPAAPIPANQLQQLVAPIALYPDALVAQILAAATYPTQVVQADRWLQQHSQVQGDQLAASADQQSWDPSVKALTAFPSVLSNLDQNLSWTEALGNAYFNQQQDVLDAVQVMRHRATDAGNLRTTPQETVVSQGTTIIIQPAAPDRCYLPIYDPWIVYGAPLAIYPGYLFDAWVGPPFISFGPAIGIGFFGRFGWGWSAWGFNWRNRVVVFNHNTYVSRSRSFFNHGPFISARSFNAPSRALPSARGNHGFTNRSAPNARAGSGWANRGPSGTRSGAGPRNGTLNRTRQGGLNRGSITRGGSTVVRSGGGRSSGGSARGGGSRGGGSRGGRHR
jgi:hypothetical protein